MKKANTKRTRPVDFTLAEIHSMACEATHPPQYVTEALWLLRGHAKTDDLTLADHGDIARDQLRSIDTLREYVEAHQRTRKPKGRK